MPIDMAANDAQPVVPPAPANPPSAGVGDVAIPLCVDLDGTLIRTDCLWEALVQMMFRRPLRLAVILAGAWRGRPWLKKQLALERVLPVDSLPYNTDVLTLIKRERAAGRKAVLVTASDQLMADAVAAHVKVFDEVVGTDGATNLKGKNKAAYLAKRFGKGGYDYAGDSSADIPVWESARHAYAVNAGSKAKRWIQRHNASTTIGAGRKKWRARVRALRPQHWVKNILVFFPVLAAHVWHSTETWLRVGGFFLALCFGASAVYLVNDLVDIESDRLHKDKWRRPIASGALFLPEALAGIPLCLVLAIGFCMTVPGWKAPALLAGYLFTTSLYSFWLKKVVILDVLFLSGFYVYRVVAGAILAPVKLSEWLIAFAMFLFLSLAAAKRYVELVNLPEDKNPNAARGYLRQDYPLVALFGVNCGCLSVLVLGLYVNSDTFQHLYTRAWIFWLFCPLLLYWLMRVWLLATRKKLHEDPVVFAIKDPVTWVVAALGCVVFLIAMSGNAP